MPASSFLLFVLIFSFLNFSYLGLEQKDCVTINITPFWDFVSLAIKAIKYVECHQTLILQSIIRIVPFDVDLL